MQNPSIEQRLTQICALGCTRVSEIITLLEQKQFAPEIDDLPAAERDQLLAELQAIMAVYQARKGNGV